MAGDIAGQFDDAFDLAAGIGDRDISRFQPDKLAGLAPALELATEGLTLAEPPPELGVFGAACEFGVAENTVVLALQFGRRISHGFAEVGVGLDDEAVGRELDHGHMVAQRTECRLQCLQFPSGICQSLFELALESEHDAAFLGCRGKYRRRLYKCLIN
jgi:hypothetical protein